MNGVEKSVVSDEILISDQTNGIQYKSKPDSCVIDMDSFSNAKEISHNSRIIRNFSRKGMLRGGNKMGQEHGGGVDDTAESISPIGGDVVGGVEKQAVVVMGSREELGGGAALSHEIAINTVHGGGGTAEKTQSFRRNSFKRSPQPCSAWYLDPRKIFLFCATLSCVGTMLLIYLAFSCRMMDVEQTQLNSS